MVQQQPKAHYDHNKTETQNNISAVGISVHDTYMQDLRHLSQDLGHCFLPNYTGTSHPATIPIARYAVSDIMSSIQGGLRRVWGAQPFGAMSRIRGWCVVHCIEDANLVICGDRTTGLRKIVHEYRFYKGSGLHTFLLQWRLIESIQGVCLLYRYAAEQTNACYERFSRTNVTHPPKHITSLHLHTFNNPSIQSINSCFALNTGT
jgi:hypothetical protein